MTKSVSERRRRKREKEKKKKHLFCDFHTHLMIRSQFAMVIFCLSSLFFFSCLEMAFAKVNADKRKEWITNYDPQRFVDHTVKELSYSDFVQKELILFSRYDTMVKETEGKQKEKKKKKRRNFVCFSSISSGDVR